MAMPKVTRSSIEAAMKEFDTKHRADTLWRDWESNKNYRYAIAEGGLRYPVKEIIRLAIGDPNASFPGGKKQGAANEAVRSLEFKVITLAEMNPKWTRDELILALDLYLKHPSKLPGADSTEVKELSALLNRMGEQLHPQRYDRYRNRNSVHMKLMNFRARDPNHPKSKGLGHGGQLEEEIWAEYGSNAPACAKAAQSVTRSLHFLEKEPAPALFDDDEEEAAEGRLVTREHRTRERSRKLVQQKKAKVLEDTGGLACQCCGFEFSSFYGERGQGYAECHHIKPISSLEEGEKTKLKDLAILCANCHRMIHRKSPWLSLEQLREILGHQSK